MMTGVKMKQIPAGVTDTLPTAIDFLNDDECREIYNITPGEGNIPLSVFKDQYSEELAYPDIFLDKKDLTLKTAKKQ